MSASKFRLALIQLLVVADKTSNPTRAVKCTKEAASKGARLPECFNRGFNRFNSPYGTQYFPQYCEPIPGESTKCLSDAAKETGTYVVGGSIPEKDGDRIYNTCAVFGPKGDLLTTYRKELSTFSELVESVSSIHIGKPVFTIDDLQGQSLEHFAISDQTATGVKLLLYPGAFNMTTGPAHWELLIRSRALDNQFFVGGVSVARDTSASYVAWSHSSLVNPWGEVVKKAEDFETILYEDIDLLVVGSTRQNILTSSQKRHDLIQA